MQKITHTRTSGVLKLQTDALLATSLDLQLVVRGPPTTAKKYMVIAVQGHSKPQKNHQCIFGLSEKNMHFSWKSTCRSPLGIPPMVSHAKAIIYMAGTWQKITDETCDSRMPAMKIVLIVSWASETSTKNRRGNEVDKLFRALAIIYPIEHVHRCSFLRQANGSNWPDIIGSLTIRDVRRLMRPGGKSLY
ncbi:hypothetical protein EVAR_63365_1 [Eumeta japonica]|uniref:Uncharacterized protein n=1 Tax=Eumeta variegata TaxID=151549 RepID=A0A4C1ZXV8_EUMVA|nr:hypothetical protein EVAR_63365_1 [Eumeta japonica]